MPIAGQVRPGFHKEDPAEVLRKQVGPLEGIEPTYSNLLIATYKRPDEFVTAGGVVVSIPTTKEDDYQSRVGLVLKVGPMAFDDVPDRISFKGFRVKPGEWVVFRGSDGMKMQIGSHKSVRLMADVHIKMTVTDPDSVY